MELKSSGGLETFNLRIKELGSKQAKVGWFETARYEDGTPVASIAAQNEFGNPGRSIPPRPTMRPAVIENEKEVERIAANSANQILAGKLTAQEAMTKIALFMEGAVSKNIATITQPPLSPITIAARKYKQQGKKITGKTIGEIAALLNRGKIDVTGVSTKPLIDSGLELATLTSVVEDATS